MPASTTVTGMVLSAMPVGDYDKRLVILTKEHGKITAFAKGARRPNSAFLACCQPFSFGDFQLYVGRNSYNILSVDIKNYFAELRDDMESVTYGLYFCEMADYLTKENNDEQNVLKLLYQTLRALIKKTIPYTLIRAIYELKIMAINGEAPQVFDCIKCDGRLKKVDTLYRFSSDCGGILCEACKGYDSTAILLSTSTLYALQYIISKDIEKLYTFTVNDRVLNELISCVKQYLSHYIDHEFKSLDLIEVL